MSKTFLDKLREAPATALKLITDAGGLLNVGQVASDALDFTGSIITINELHALGHKGILFSASVKFTLPASDVVYLTGLTGLSSIHWDSFDIASTSGEIEVRLRENVAATNGTPITPICRNRHLLNISEFELVALPTVSDAGDVLDIVGIPGASIPAQVRPQSGGDNIEWVLKPETKYALELTNLNATEKTVYGRFSWYEPGLLLL